MGKSLFLFSCLFIFNIIFYTGFERDNSTSIPNLHPYNIKVEKLDSHQIKALIHNRNGKNLILNIWATWCIPCKDEFPALIKLQNYYNGKDYEIVAISVDYPDEIYNKVIPMLDSLKVNFNVFVADVLSDTELINLLNPGWNGAIPATFIYDKNGKLKVFLLGEQSFNDLKNKIKKAYK